jgi:hypothetical protein
MMYTNAQYMALVAASKLTIAPADGAASWH